MDEKYQLLLSLIKELPLKDQIRVLKKAIWSCKQKIKYKGEGNAE